MKWRTGISQKREGELFIKGTSLTDLMKSHTFVQTVFLLLRGSLPSKEEEVVGNALFISSIEHGIEPPSAFVPRTVASVGNSINASLAAGVLAIGEHHGGAGEHAAKLLQSENSPEDIVEQAITTGTRLPGLGHPLYKDIDPRAELLFSIAKERGVAGAFTEKMIALQKVLHEKTGKKLPINVDGAHAALFSDMQFDWQLVKALFIFSRVPGMIAHIHEEVTYEKPYRRIDGEDVEFREN